MIRHVSSVTKHRRSMSFTLYALISCSRRIFRTHTTCKSATDNSSPFGRYLTDLGYSDERIQNGVRKALALSFGDPVNESHLKMLGNEGIHSLVSSVQSELESNQTPREMVHIAVPHHGISFELSMRHGQSFMHLATEDDQGKILLGEYLECVCNGNMSCSTCHVILDPTSFSKCEPPSEAECDMLDLAYEPTETSRLGCQVVMKKELAGMTVTIPAGVYNLWK